MRILKKTRHSKIDVFVKFESAINLEIRGQIKKKLDSFYLGHRDHMYAFSSKSGSEPFRALGDLTWNDPRVFFRTFLHFLSIHKMSVRHSKNHPYQGNKTTENIVHFIIFLVRISSVP